MKLISIYFSTLSRNFDLLIDNKPTILITSFFAGLNEVKTVESEANVRKILMDDMRKIVIDYLLQAKPSLTRKQLEEETNEYLLLEYSLEEEYSRNAD